MRRQPSTCMSRIILGLEQFGQLCVPPGVLLQVLGIQQPQQGLIEMFTCSVPLRVVWCSLCFGTLIHFAQLLHQC